VSSTYILGLSGGLCNRRLFSRRPAYERRSKKITSTRSALSVTPTTGKISQLVNIILDSSTNYASWRDLMEQALQLTPSLNTSRAMLHPMIQGGYGWIASSSTGSTTPSHQNITRWFGNAAAQCTICGSPSRTSFPVTVSNIHFILTLPFAILFRVTSR
jgi:hypothetical protein